MAVKSKPVKAKLMVKEYTVKHPVSIAVEFEPAHRGGKAYLGLLYITSTNKVEDELLNADGEFACWDGEILVDKDYFICMGADSPGGGAKTMVRILVPRNLVTKFQVGC